MGWEGQNRTVNLLFHTVYRVSDLLTLLASYAGLDQ